MKPKKKKKTCDTHSLFFFCLFQDYLMAYNFRCNIAILCDTVHMLDNVYSTKRCSDKYII